MDDDIDWGSLDAGPGAVDLSGIDLSSLFNQNSGFDASTMGDYGGSLSDELAAALSDSGNSSSLFSGDGGIDLSSLMDGVGDLDQAAPPSGIADLLSSMAKDSGGDLAGTDWNALANEGLTPEQIAKREDLMKFASDRNQDFGGADVTKYLDEFNQNFNPAGGFGSQWQTSGSDRIMVNDDGTGIGINTETGESYSLDKNQVDKMVANNQINNKASGYVDATGGKGYVPGGGKTIINSDGTKSVIGTDGKVYTITKDGTVIDTGKTVNVNDKTIETKTIKEIIDNTKKTVGGGGGTTTKPAASNNSGMLMALLALMAMMNKGGGSSGSSAVIPSLTADRKQLPYGPASGSTARPGAGGVTYFSPTTYTKKAAGGGLMSLAGGGQLSPEELTQQLQAYKASAPTTQEDFAKQQSLWNDYADRYANSSWNYANMGGKPQDYSLKPADYLQKQVTGYADPINQFMSQTQQNTPTYSLMQDILTNKPQVNEAFKTVLAANPDAFKNDPSIIEATIRNLSADLNQFGSDTALKHFYQDQQNLVGLGSENREQIQTMDNPQYAALQKQIMDKTTKVSDPAWNAMSKKGVGQNDITSFWRDPVSGLGIGSDASGQTLMYFDRDGRPLSSSVIGDLGKNAIKYGFNLPSLGALTKKAAGGGMMYGGGGISDLGGYSDGGRLLKGPGDGVSDSIPATIGGKQPARLAEGEFVVPARIVSELGNGSTDAGAQKLYAMMDRVQNARRKTKNVAADTKAHKYLPA